MNKTESYAGIDFFRVIAAFLVITIHTSPLMDSGETADFILTRVIARAAVPFFFMTSGFFLIRRYHKDAGALKRFVRKTALIYAAAILLYVPINIYNGYFSMESLLPNMIKDIVFDGTFYHLWYLPASITGAVIAWRLVKRLDGKGAFFVTLLLYLIGVFGDSYYGIAERIPVFKGFYGLIFEVSDYTRNGIFFAPVFFVLGGMIADRKPFSIGKSICGFAVSFCLMLLEALLLRSQNVQRHDSMYLFLLPCMFFLFHAVLRLRGKRMPALRTFSLFVYLIHPFVIVILRLFAKLCGLEHILIETSAVHFAGVCLISTAAAAVFTFLCQRFGKKGKPSFDTDRAFIEIDLGNLEHNVGKLQEIMPSKSRLMAVVKTGAYGHGAFEISTHLEQMGVGAFAVATIDEGISLRKYGIRGEILILGITNPARAGELKKYHLMQSVVDYGYAVSLNEQNVPVRIHIKLDSGMHRLGIPADDVSSVERIFGMKNMKVEGIYTHLCCADSRRQEDITFTEKQIALFYRCVDALKADGIETPKLHIQSSYGLLNYPQLRCDYVRIGIALYGVLSTPDSGTKQRPDLKPVLSLKARVAVVQKVSKGDGAGYGRDFVAERDSRLAILSIGYGDGFPRNLSGKKGGVIIHGQYAPVVGRVCMDSCTVDVTDIDGVLPGDLATLIAAQEARVSAPRVAESAGSISNELLCRMGTRLPVITK